MPQVIITATIDISKDYYNLQDPEELEWFTDMLNDKENTFLQLWSNDIGDEIGSTPHFTYEIVV